MRLGSAPPRGQKEVALNNRNNRNSVTPLAYLLSQPFLANVSAPLSCPIENVPSVAVVVASPAEAAPLTSIESALVSDDEKFSRHEQSLVNGRLQRVGDKGKLFALSRSFICRCVALQADASLTNEAGDVLVSVDHMEQHLQVRGYCTESCYVTEVQPRRPTADAFAMSLMSSAQCACCASRRKRLGGSLSSAACAASWLTPCSPFRRLLFAAIPLELY
jgi:hypothetical protein